LATLGLQDMLNRRTTLGIKRMGGVDRKAFEETCLLKFPNEDTADISAKLCSSWEESVKDPHWHPFKKAVVKGQLQVHLYTSCFYYLGSVMKKKICLIFF
jgi:hypothetical protein